MKEKIIITSTDSEVINKVKRQHKIKVRFNMTDAYKKLPQNLLQALYKCQTTRVESKLLYHALHEGYGYNDRKGWTPYSRLVYYAKDIQANHYQTKKAMKSLQLKKMLFVAVDEEDPTDILYSLKINKHFDTWDCQGLDNLIDYEKRFQQSRMLRIKEKNEQNARQRR